MNETRPPDDPGSIAGRLGIPVERVEALQRRGYLLWLDAGGAEIKRRLWAAHLALLRLGDCHRGKAVVVRRFTARVR
jgi:hypothetical protein